MSIKCGVFNEWETFELKGSAWKSSNNRVLDHISYACVGWFTERSVYYILMILVDSNSIRYCMEPKFLKKIHALASLRPPVLWKPLLLPHLSVAAPTILYFPDLDIIFHSSSHILASSHNSNSLLASVQPSGIRSYSGTNHLPTSLWA